MSGERGDGAADARPLVSVLVPAFNEEATLRAGIAALDRELAALARLYTFEIVIVDDGSADATGWIAAAIASGRSDVHVVTLPANRGLGVALRSGFAATSGDVVVVLDADMSYAPSHVAPLLEALAERGAAVAAASPYRPGGSVRGVPPLRLALSMAANRLLRTASGGLASAATGMVRAYHGAWVRALPLTAEGMEVNGEIVRHALRLGAPIVEVPAHLDWTSSGRAAGGRRSSLRIGRQVAATLRLAAALLLERARAARRRAR